MKKYYWLIGILVGGLTLRLYSLTKISLWHDEAFSALMLRYPWSEMMQRLAADVHPPLYYILLRFWVGIFGESVFWLRGFSVFCGVLAIWLTYYIVEKYFANKKAAILSALFLAVNFFQIHRGSLEARMYTLGVLLLLAATASLLSALYYRGTTKKSWMLYMLFAVFGASLIYTHYYLAFNLIALGIYALGYMIKNYGKEWRKYLPFFGSTVAVAILYIPWIKPFLFQLGQVQEGFWIWAMTRWSIPYTFWDLTFGWHSGKIPTGWMLVAVTALAIIMMYGLIKTIKYNEKWLILLGILAPFAGALLFLAINRLQGNTSSVYLIRYFVLIGPFYLIALALWISEWKRSVGFWTISGLVIVLNLTAFATFWHEQGAATKPGMAGAVAYLNQYANGPKDKTIVGTPFEYFNLKYYSKTINPPKLYTNGRAKVSDLAHYDGTSLLAENDLAADLKTSADAEDTVWLVWTRAYSSDKPMTPANWTQIQEREYEDVMPYLGTTIYITQYKVN